MAKQSKEAGTSAQASRAANDPERPPAARPAPQLTETNLRHAGASELAQALSALRERRMVLWKVYREALPSNMEVPYGAELNPPRWELGHVGWFEEFWIARNPQRMLGAKADPTVARAASVVPRSDALYDSSRVAHTRRWHLDLPDAPTTCRQLDHIRERTLALLPGLDGHDDSLYFPRLVAVHEAMHLEAWFYMAQQLAINLRAGGLPLQPKRCEPLEALPVAAQGFACGHNGGGFAFDNELQAHSVDVAPFSIDSAPVTWGRYLPFIEAGGYDEPRHWSTHGWAWRKQHSNGRPRHVNQQEGRWQRAAFGEWLPLHPDEPVVHVNAHEAQAWCHWAGRRLPSEAEWECAAVTLGEAFDWGQVWEWTASPFAPYAGFEPHPYREYSQPWFDGRPVLRGASFATWPGLVSPRYRNYFTADRQDVFSGFRSCAFARV